MERKLLHVTVVDMQPIMPAVGGGRQRLLGLYHALGEDIRCTYIGSYDWPGEPYRDQQLTPGLREVVVPLSAAQHAAAAELSGRLANRTVIDIAFADQVTLSPPWLAAAREQIANADVVVFSHPWCFPPLADDLSDHQLIVYDSQNVESVLRMSLFDDLPEAAPLIQRVAGAEFDLCRRADLVLACSHEDAATFHRIFGIDWTKLRTVPNGIFALRQAPPSAAERAVAKQTLGVTQEALVLFLGSGYGPNNAAARYIGTQLARRMPRTGFAIVGGSGESLAAATLPRNVHAPGIVDEARKHLWLTAADAAINPILEGSGTCIKMFDYMAAGLPVVTTVTGSRGILRSASPAFLKAGPDTFAQALQQLLGQPGLHASVAASGRRLVEENYAWERISPRLGTLLAMRSSRSESTPFFTVVIPTYERHQQLDALMHHLDAQSSIDFEVIVVDQSAHPWSHDREAHPFSLRYVRSDIKGAVAARNLGGFLARGEVIAFTDDDCEPRPDWLANARRWFRDPHTVGLEGFIRSDHLDEPEWRPVTNIGCIGLGFMTANLLVRNAAFQQLDGFDSAFDRPHFREDTDFGWRLQKLGKVPFAPDVEVFHPAQSRGIERESTQARGRFFVKDALLLKKHPEKYRELFCTEAHYAGTEGFWENLCRGLELYKIKMPDWMRPYAADADIAMHGVDKASR